MPSTYTIYAGHIDTVTEQLAKLAKKATTYGGELNYTFGEPYVKKIDRYSRTPEGETVKKSPVYVTACDVTLDYDGLICNGNWSVLAMLDHTVSDARNVVTVYGDSVNLEWYSLPPRCDHCNTTRRRDVTFIVRSSEEETRQVGKTCLKDYTGIDPRLILIKSSAEDILDEDEPREDNVYGEERCYNTRQILAYAVRALREQGYVKSSETGSNRDLMARLASQDAPVEASDFLEADRIINLLAQLDDVTLNIYFLMNARVIIDGNYCTSKMFGHLAYVPLGVRRYEEDLRSRKNGGHVGAIGDRIDVEVESVELVTSWMTEYGVRYLYRFTTTDGKVLVWKTMKELGTTSIHRMRVTVNEHSERKGVPTTVVSRCKILF